MESGSWGGGRVCSQTLAFPRLRGAQPVWPSAALGELLVGGAHGGADVALHRPPRQAHLCSRPRSGQVRHKFLVFLLHLEWSAKWSGNRVLSSAMKTSLLKGQVGGGEGRELLHWVKNLRSRAWVQQFSVLWLILTCDAAAFTGQTIQGPVCGTQSEGRLRFFYITKNPFLGFNF